MTKFMLHYPTLVQACCIAFFSSGKSGLSRMYMELNG